MWLNTNLTTRGSNCNIFLFSLYQGYPLKIAFWLYQLIMKHFFFYLSRHVTSRHIVYGQDTRYMDIFYQATLCRWTVLEVHTDGQFIPRRSRRDIVLVSSVRPSVRQSVHTFCLAGTISQYLLVRFNSFLVQMISTTDSRYPISLVKIHPLTLELLPLFKYRQL